MIRGVIFDYFDVIRPDGYKRWVATHGLTGETKLLPITKARDAGKLSTAEFFAALATVTGQSPEAVEHELEDSKAPDKAILQLIKSLRPQYKTALLSNSDGSYLRDELQANQLESYFNEIIISSEVGYNKPDPEIYKIAIGRLALPAEACLFIDDNPHNIAGADAVGLHTILYSGFHKLEEQLAAHNLIA